MARIAHKCIRRLSPQLGAVATRLTDVSRDADTDPRQLA